MATMSLQAAYDQARSYLEANQVEQAIGVAQHILEYFPENLEAHRILGEAYLASRQFDQAELAFGRALHADPENIPAHVGLGITFERQGKLDRAVAEFEQALEVRPDMPELRGQLLRLYTDLWGAEGATLRLSRPGLARLYAKGHMLPQAIQEFRSVIDEHPERFDARVGLAEALWRDGQTEVAAETCEGILAERADVLKANLLLGYIRLGAGDESGEPYWRLAQQLDPYQQVARSLFEALPDVPPPDLNIPAWEETAWLERRAREEQQRRASPEAAVEVEPQPALVAAAAAGDDGFESWLDQVDEPAEQPPVSEVAPPPDDDFLASLLALDTPPLPGEAGSDLDSTSGITPFSFDELDAGRSAPPPPEIVAIPELDLADELAPAIPPAAVAGGAAVAAGAFAAAQADEPAEAAEELEPFSLADLGLSDEEIAQLEGGAPAAAAPEGATEELEPFSLADLGLSDEEIAQLEGGAPAAAAPEGATEELEPFSLADLGLSDEEIAQLEGGAPAAAAPEGATEELEPFSLADLGLSDEEIAQLEGGAPAAAAPEGATEELEPFSLADLGLSPDEVAELNAAQTPTLSEPGSALSFVEDEPGLEPFSLADLGLSEEEIASLSDGGVDQPGLEPFSLADLGLSPDEVASLDSASAPAEAAPAAFSLDAFAEPEQDDAAQGGDFDADLGDLQPFSLDDLDLNALGDEGGIGSLPPSLQPFSLDEVPPPPPSPSTPLSLEPDEPGEASGGYSWQQPSAKGQTDFVRGAASEAPQGSIFGRLRQQASERPAEEPPPLAPVSDDDAAAAGYFSNDDVQLRDDEPGTADRFAGGFRLPKEGEPQGAPAAGLAAGALAGAAALAAASAAKEQPPAEPPPAEPPVAADAEPELTPFSLEDLGLSPEEIAQLQAAESQTTAAAADAEPELTPFSLEDLGLSPEEIAALEAANRGELPLPVTGETIVPGWSHGEEPELTPFAPDEVTAAPAAEPPAAEVQPFSLDDLDFGEGSGGTTAAGIDEGIDETVGVGVEPFSLDDFDFDTGESGTSEAGIDDSVGSDVQPFSLDDLGLGDTGAPADPSRELSLTAEELAGLDLGEFETLIGDPSATTSLASDDPAAALERLIALGRQQGYVDLTDIIGLVSDPEAEADRIEEMGWALHNAGIQIRDGDEVIDMEAEEAGAEEEELAEAAPAEVAPAFEGEPDLTPFSLSELGLSDEEIAALGLEDSASSAPAEPVAPTATKSDDEPELTPFSLEDLGLSPEEIALLEGAAAEGEAAPVVEPAAEPEAAPATGEPELTPFSLEDLGLSPEEIALLEGAAAEGEAAPVVEPAAEPEAAPATGEPELTPFSLEDLGLSPEEIALLQGVPEEESAEAAADDLFDFGAVEAAPVEKVTKRTEPRVEEPPPPVDPADVAFTAEPLDSLDDIWHQAEAPAAPAATAPAVVAAATPAPAAPERTGPARVVLPPLGERRREPPPPRATTPRSTDGERGSLSRDDERYARREAAARRSRDDDRFGRRDRRDTALWREAPPEPATPARPIVKEFAGFVPTGDAILDDYLGQLDGEPDNFGLALAIGRLCAQTGRPAIMSLAFKRLVRAGEGVAQLTEELEGLLGTTDDPGVKQQLYRLLGDAYSKQGRYREAMDAYGTTFGR